MKQTSTCNYWQQHQFRHANFIKNLIDVMNQSFQISSQVEYSKNFSQQQRWNKKQRRSSIKFLNIVDENDISNFIWRINDFNALEVRVTIDNLKKIIVENLHDFIETIKNIVKQHRNYVKRVKNLKQKNSKLTANIQKLNLIVNTLKKNKKKFEAKIVKFKKNK